MWRSASRPRPRLLRCGCACVLCLLLAAHHEAQLPLSKATKRALTEANFVRQTAIQRMSIPHSLVGRNVIGLAKTGSGKCVTKCRVLLLVLLLTCISLQG